MIKETCHAGTENTLTKLQKQTKSFKLQCLSWLISCYSMPSNQAFLCHFFRNFTRQRCPEVHVLRGLNLTRTASEAPLALTGRICSISLRLVIFWLPYQFGLLKSMIDFVCFTWMFFLCVSELFHLQFMRFTLSWNPQF